MTLEKLVPSLKLCEQIPDGKFADSALVWRLENSSFPDKPEYYHVYLRGTGESMLHVFPAPTLAEILEELPRSVNVERVIDDQYPDEWGVCCRELYELSHGQRLKITRGRADERAVNAALKLWMELEGGK